VLAGLLLGGCDARVCSEPGVCWANRADLRAAAARCGADNFELREAAGTWLPYVAGEDPDTGPKTRCIIDDLQGQGLMVTH
jgi:hypothetical protein